VVQKNGAGAIETDYNAAGKVVETRTLDAGGKLQQKVDYQYLPGYYVAQQTDTTFGPDGKARKLVRVTYDESANFTGEFIQVFNDSGKQIGGHQLTHDPWTNVYRCSEWSLAIQNYQVVACPAGEEETGEAEEIKKFTYEEVASSLEAARKAAREGQTPAHAQLTTTQKEVGLVLPAHAHPGERISGTVVENPEQYEDQPEVAVTRIMLPFESSNLSDLQLQVAGEKPQPADGPITFVIPRSGSALDITFQQAGNAAHSLSRTLNFPQPSPKPRPPDSFQSDAFCLKGRLCAAHGPFSGDSSKTFAGFEARPAAIVAETSDAAYVSVPELTAPGARSLFIAEGSKLIAFPVVVGEFVIKNNGRELKAGDTLIMFPTLDGPSDIPAATWQPDNFTPATLDLARQLIPRFQLRHRDHETEAKRDADEEKEKEEKEKEDGAGEILLVVKNATPDQISLRSSTNDMLVFRLNRESFRRGEFKYDLLVEASKAGKAQVKGYVIPLLAPLAGQEFSLRP